jgi:hypothetical protein
MRGTGLRKRNCGRVEFQRELLLTRVVTTVVVLRCWHELHRRVHLCGLTATNGDSFVRQLVIPVMCNYQAYSLRSAAGQRSNSGQI